MLAQQGFGNITPPKAVSGLVATDIPGKLVQRAISIFILGAGVYALFNLILAGYDFISAGDDAKKVAGAWSKITNTFLGITVAVGSIALLAIFSKLLTGDYKTLLMPTLPTF